MYKTGVRIEKRILKVLKGLAEALDMSLGDLLEGIAFIVLKARSRSVTKRYTRLVSSNRSMA